MKSFFAFSISWSVQPSKMNSVPRKSGSKGSDITACKVSRSSKSCFPFCFNVISPYFVLIRTLTSLLNNVARASFSPTPNFPTTNSLFCCFSTFSFWVRWTYCKPLPKSLIEYFLSDSFFCLSCFKSSRCFGVCQVFFKARR